MKIEDHRRELQEELRKLKASESHVTRKLEAIASLDRLPIEMRADFCERLMTEYEEVGQWRRVLRLSRHVQNQVVKRGIIPEE